MDNNKLDDELLDEDLSEFFNDEDNTKKSEGTKLVNELVETFNVQKDHMKLQNIKDFDEYKDMIKKIKDNLNSFQEIYGVDVAKQLQQLLENEEELDRVMEEFFEKRMEFERRMATAKNVGEQNSVSQEEMRFIMRFAAMHPEMDTVYLYFTLDNMIDRRKEALEEGSGSSSGNNATSIEDDSIVPELVGAAVGYTLGLKTAQILNSEDKAKYLQNFFKKIELIESKAGVKLDPEFIKFFTSDEYILANDLKLPELLQDENYDKLKDTWSLPAIVDDLRAEEANKELYAADDSIKAMEKFYAENYGNTQDNSVIEALKGLSGDVQEEKERIEQDIEFFKKEKMKERIEVAVLASVAGMQNNKTVATLANLLKESITSRVNYMKDETNLRDMRKETISDMSNKDNEKNSKDYFEALQGVNMAINKRREERAKGNVSFIPKIIVAKNELKQNEISNDEKEINAQDLSMGGRQKVLSYVNKYSNNNNIAS